MARNAAERKAEQRARLETAVAEQEPDEWNETVCLHVLASPRWRSGEIGKAAWERLGELRGYKSSRDSHKNGRLKK
ncbi:hypothetical protein LRD18_08720 [Halorhodospira halochloris]|uniref:hypothetical protein n=1 Tax=Halorhodospira halochloris TaxID=1052 RepID=UPI001EE7B605|nr:hypothetical protein [Halorhodospira halochloris]MCG5530954.1 hypothetical protein [Halorhodospira halochloris]